MTALRRDAPAEPVGARRQVADIDPADSPWSPLEMLAATIVDEIRILRWAYGTAHGGKAPSPSPLRRPGTGSPPRSRMTDEMRRRIDPRLRAVPDLPGEIPALPAGG
jgi:hypothetical protein